MTRNTRRPVQAVPVIIGLALWTACTGSGTPTPLVITATPGPVGVSVGGLTSQAPLVFSSATPVDTAVPPTSTPVPYKSLTVCLPTEPQSLYTYSSGDRDSLWARDVVLETLRDGPIDHRNFEYQPVLVDRLPALKTRNAALNAAPVSENETLIDARGNITTLVDGVHYFDPAGVEQVYSGGAPVQVMQMTLTFRLLAGLKWEDGAPLTSADLLLSWQVAKDPANVAADHYLTNRALDPVATDSRTLTLTFLPGFKDPLFFTRLPLPLPGHLYGKMTAAELAADAQVNRRPISFGPFMLNDWAPGDHLTVVRNPNYYRAGEGLPHLNQINFIFVADPRQMVERMQAGTCQIALAALDSYFAPQTGAIAQAAAQGVFLVQSVPSTTFEHLDFNLSPAAGYRGVAGTGLFQDVRIRTAFAFCIDRRSLIDTLVAGRGEVPVAYVPSSHPDYPAALRPIPFDPAQGQALLRAAGWKDTNGDGVVDKNGRLSLDYVYGPTDNPLRQAIAADLQIQLLKNCGIQINPRELSRSDLFGDYPDGVLFGRLFDVGQFSWVGGQAEPSCGLYSRSEWTGLGDGQADQYGLFGYPGGGNDVGYINPAFDDACLRALGSLDPAEKKTLHQQALKLFAADEPSIILFFRPKLALVRPDVIGFALDSTQDSALWNAERLDLAP